MLLISYLKKKKKIEDCLTISEVCFGFFLSIFVTVKREEKVRRVELQILDGFERII